MTDTPHQVLQFRTRPRLVHDHQREGQPGPSIKDRMKRSRAWLDSGMKAEDICRCERAHSLGIIRREAEALALFETRTSAANALRDVADEIEKGDVA